MAKKNEGLKPNPADVAANTIDIRVIDISKDPYLGAPRRIEFRPVVGLQTTDWRVTVMQPATMGEVLAGLSELQDPKDETSAKIAWKPITAWQRLTGHTPSAEVHQLLDPDLLVN